MIQQACFICSVFVMVVQRKRGLTEDEVLDEDSKISDNVNSELDLTVNPEDKFCSNRRYTLAMNQQSDISDEMETLDPEDKSLHPTSRHHGNKYFYRCTVLYFDVILVSGNEIFQGPFASDRAERDKVSVIMSNSHVFERFLFIDVGSLLEDRNLV
ncbi:hypothetical protein QYM36_011649 [Artemia franciscana]|uniref:Uncharacterized protein n=1 Tax=Artemia franciscana TaxID=6661 RepID=A0AA88HP14_ARTSF|nr:hypothetical protein QYM36_011649 [Artemia franciscana]